MVGGIGGIGGGGGIDPIGTDPDPKPDPQPKLDPSAARLGNEEIVWRARAVRAEARVEELEARVSEVESQLASAKAEASQAEQRRELELELTLAGAIDLETATLLAHQALDQMESPDVRAVIADLKRRKSFLFRPASPASAMSGHVASGGGDLLEDLASEARQSGNRTAVLKYLRARRGA
ncbi:MAG: hypothetical protein KF757_13375 [Phycisphaeraceae bacterium]|nr:hypothetical protein [Phycisphaeraceae bacterium]MCW5763953.1 hypothetical protein [Phycisphaeraceae bacterium]